MWAVLGTLAVSNVMANQVLPAWAYIPWNLTVAAALVLIAVRSDGLGANHLGLATRRLPDGLRWGAAVSTGLITIYLIGLALPWTRDVFNDDRADVGVQAMLWRTLVAIPLGTVLMEEIAFRGVLPAMFRRRTAGHPSGALRADLYASLLFGAWHVLPSLDLTESNQALGDLLPGPVGVLLAIAGGVVGTALAGMVLTWLRNRSGSLAAPVMVHITSNSVGYVIAWFLHR
jgi:membrane protease YdiL (CAAX protease family)